ncbi:ABC transporter substrate-binding protein [Dongia sp.]|uniref:ABC transporter substrate-binding protein n=1 Tax=Dongia sp. TaxID=1977262 RepID=UPI0037507ADF
MMNLPRRAFNRAVLLGSLGVASTQAWPGMAVAAEGDTLKIALMKPAGNLDPHIYRGVWGVQSIIYDPLVVYGDNGTLNPGLAESWSVSEDGKVLTFKLRKNVKFHDGTPWNAEALKWNFDRWIGKEDHSWIVTSANYDSLKIVDPETVELHLKKRIPQALMELTVVRPVRFLSPASAAADGKYQTPIGTGPWKVESSDEGKTVMVRNEDYWGQKPKFAKIEFVVMPDGRSRTAALRAGEIDIAGGDYVSPITPEDADILKSGGVGVVTVEGTNTFVLGFNTQRPKLQDPRVRQAISLSVDRTAICNVIYAGYASPTANLFPASVPYGGKRIPVPARDVAAAKKLLDEAGWTGDGTRSKDGQPLAFELVLSEEAVHGSRAAGEVIQAELREVGIEVTIRSLDHATRHGDIPEGKYDLTFFYSIGAPYDPHSTLTNYFLSTFYNGADGKMFTSTELDPFLTEAIEGTGASPEESYQKVYDWIEKNHAIAPLLHPQRIWAHTARVQNFKIPPTEYDMPYEGISLQS